MLMQKQFLVFIFSALFCGAVVGQQEDISAAEKSFNALNKGGVLVIKLPTSSKKMAAMNKRLKDQPNSRLEKIRAKELEKLTKMQGELMSGFKEFYTFSPFVAIFDSNYLKLLKNPALSNVFMDEKLQLIPDFSLKDKTFLAFRLDQYFYADHEAKEAFILVDKEGVPVPRPFPPGIPYKFRNLSLMPDPLADIFGLTNVVRNIGGQSKYYTKYKWRDLSKKPYHAIVKMLQIKLDVFQKFLDYKKS